LTVKKLPVESRTKQEEAGIHTIQWDASQLAVYKSGFYFVRLSTEGRILTRKMLLVQ